MTVHNVNRAMGHRVRLPLVGLLLVFLVLFGNAAAQKSTLTIAINGDISNFDPAVNQLILYEALIRDQVFNALTGLDGNMQVVPGLAESWDQKDPTTWVFHLRHGVKFQDGSTFTANDVIATFKRTIDQKMIFASKLKPIESMKALDDYTLELKLKSPDATLLPDLYQVAITPASATADSLKHHPVGTGPFEFVSWTPNQSIVLKRYDNYWGPKPKVDQVVLRVLPDATSAVSNLLAGEVDAVYDVPVDSLQLIKGNKNVVVQQPKASGSLFLIELGVNNVKALQDPRVREALAYSLDKKTISEVAYSGYGSPQCSPLPKFSWAYTQLDCPTFDLQKAKSLLDQAGYGKGLEFGVDIISGSSEMKSIATVWQADLAKIGVKLDIKSSEVNVWLDHYVNKKYDTILNFFNSGSDPNSIFDIIYKPDLAKTYDNPTMLQQINDAVQTSAKDARTKIYTQLQQETIEQNAPVIILESRPLLSLTRSNVSGWSVNGKNVPNLLDVTIN